MPSMLGLTTDPSPHGISGKAQGQNKEQWSTENANYGQEMAMQAAGSMSGALTAGREKSGGGNGSGKKSSWKTPKRKHVKKDNPNKPRIPDEKSASHDDGGRKNTIKERNQEAAVEMETLIWRALCDRPKDAMKYMGKDAVVCNWLIFGDTEPRDKDSEPTLKESLEDCEPYMSYKMHASQVVEIGLMAVTIVYEVTLMRQAGKPNKDGSIRIVADEATVSSTWRQKAGGDWELGSMMVG